MTAQDRVKVLLLGDTGVGKTSLVHLLCNGKVLANPQWTVGCHFEVLVANFFGLISRF